ncbi:MAG: PAS domain S-box protein [Deltaproteobacteria bacterium]|nr:PAS domain S-box protein [Deltaproteobacteria bacterium]
MIKFRSMLNYLVIGIMAFMIALTAIFIYTSVHMKDRITFRIVQQTELISDLITRSAVNIMSTGHTNDQYEMVLQYGNMIGIDDIGVYKLDGTEAFGGRPVLSGTKSELPVGTRSIIGNEKESFKNTVRTANSTGFFDSGSMTYSRYVPLKADESACQACHRDNNALLGVMKIRLSTEHDFELLNYIRKLIWTLGLIVCLPVGALLVAGAIIREKNRIYAQLKESNANIKKTYNELDETKYYLQMILDNSRVIIVTTDTAGRIVEFNKEAEQLLEYSKAEVVGKDVLMLYHNPGQRSMLMNMGRPIDDKVWEVRNRDVTLHSRSGKVFHVTLTLSTMVNDMGRIIGTVGVGKDISEQKMLQFKILQSEKLAGIGTLASGIAHEINNPLAGILGMAEAIRDEDDVSLIKSYTNDIIEYTVNAKNIVRELSAYSRSVQNEARSTVDLTAVIESSLKMARHSASFMEIEIVEDLREGSFINANPVEIQQVFVNLMVNAIHAMGDRGTLTLKCAREGALVWASVADTGHGISEENLNQIFDPFFTTKPVGMGTGLGLYVVYRIVTKYRGLIDVESKHGVGTSFTLRFPSAEAPLPEDSDRI